MAGHRPQRGFTLIELMVVVAIIGIMMAIAVVSIRGTSYAGTPHGYAEEIAVEVDNARMRAVATGRWQQFEIQDTEVLHWEATTVGMGMPVNFDLVRRLGVPRNVWIVAMDGITHMAPNVSLPAEGDGLGGTINFAPDGTGQSATIFIRDTHDKDHRRVAIFRATGTAYVFKNW